MPFIWFIALAGAYILLTGESAAAKKPGPVPGLPQLPPIPLVTCSYYLVAPSGERTLVVALKQIDDEAVLAAAKNLVPSKIFRPFGADFKLMRECSGQPPALVGEL